MRKNSLRWVKEQSCYFLLSITCLVGGYLLVFKKLNNDLEPWENSQSSLNRSEESVLEYAILQGQYGVTTKLETKNKEKIQDVTPASCSM